MHSALLGATGGLLFDLIVLDTFALISAGNWTKRNLHPWLDISTDPILVVRYPANSNTPEAAAQVKEFYDLFCAWVDRTRDPYTVIADTTAIEALPSARVRAAIAEGEARTAAFKGNRNKGTAVIVANRVTRGLVTAVYWLSPPTYPVQLFATFDEGLAWVLTRLDSEGVQRPHQLPRAF